MINKLLRQAKTSDRSMRSITGMTIQQFQNLNILFFEEIKIIRNKKKRQRAEGGGRKGVLRYSEEKLFFILLYLKIYPTYDFVGILFQVDRSQPCRWVKFFIPILEKLLKKSFDLPKRKIRSFKEFEEAFPDTYDIFIDVTERRSRRPSSSKNRKRRYSGKKKYHTRKNTIIVNEHKHIGYLSCTKNGRYHDFNLFKKELVFPYINKNAWVWVDKAYVGIKKMLPPDKVIMPKKKTKNKPLTNFDKKNNQSINSMRIVVEHAIGGMKRFTCMQVPIRNQNFSIENNLPLICAGLWNFNLKIR